jgi:uncharacterized protein (DUF1499 family)
VRYGRQVRNAIGLLGALATAVGPLVAHFGVLPPLGGFVLFALGGLVSVLTGLVSVVALIRGRPLTLGGGLGVLAGIAFFAIAFKGAGYPRINDFTTDTADPPAFRFATAIPQNGGRDMTYPKEYEAVQRECCADLRPAMVKAAPAEAYARALRVAGTMPAWTLTKQDESGLGFEAIATSKVFRFQDDIAVRVRPAADGTSRVDIRSKSRDGKGDIGANTTRIHAFVDAVEASR